MPILFGFFRFLDFANFTLHYVDATFNLNKWTLEVTKIPGKHDAPSIAAALLRCFLSWNLDRKKCVRFLRDGASNITKACKDIVCHV
ncbi:Zinc finger BED domain containing hypothetical protein 4-like [Phytophthora palmivora]|uniref:Uncharacterized protein n=1 Tax=Phytophthora palmivora TaxID=4796 RepID=A0A2P4Y6W3_9STRA|nr:Zinc finger BED domain containing hypothetical protein 4-like [Phytophthora palmivora]